eukprot:1151618-Pelagomonas_calceolata.AAC.5
MFLNHNSFRPPNLCQSWIQLWIVVELIQPAAGQRELWVAGQPHNSCNPCSAILLRAIGGAQSCWTR